MYEGFQGWHLMERRRRRRKKILKQTHEPLNFNLPPSLSREITETGLTVTQLTRRA